MRSNRCNQRIHLHHFLQLSVKQSSLHVASVIQALMSLVTFLSNRDCVVRDCSIPPKMSGKCRCSVKMLELDAVIYVWWLCNTKGNKKSILSLDMEKMVDCRVDVGISEMLNLKKLKFELKLCMNILPWFLAALEPAEIEYTNWSESRGAELIFLSE